MTNATAGGPAFPVSTVDGEQGHQDSHTTWQFPGMSLRDYFAAKAMVYVAGTAELDHVGPTELAAACYEHADAMLYARQDFVVRQDIAAVERQLEAATARGDRMTAALRALTEHSERLRDPAREVREARALLDDESIPF